MSVFDNHLDHKVIDKDNDRMILEHYKISNSGATLIPKKGTFMLSKAQKNLLRRQPKLSPIPEGTFKEEHSVFRSMYGGLNENESSQVYPVFEEILRGMNLPCLIYNNKRYYQVNREIKRQIAHQIQNRINN